MNGSKKRIVKGNKSSQTEKTKSLINEKNLERNVLTEIANQFNKEKS